MVVNATQGGAARSTAPLCPGLICCRTVGAQYKCATSKLARRARNPVARSLKKLPPIVRLHLRIDDLFPGPFTLRQRHDRLRCRQRHVIARLHLNPERPLRGRINAQIQNGRSGSDNLSNHGIISGLELDRDAEVNRSMISRMSVTLLLAMMAAPGFAQEPRFDAVVAPLLIERCIDCHGGAKPKGGLDLTKQASAFKGGKNGPAIVAGNAEQSTLWQRVEAGEMPPKKPLPEKEKAILKAWIASGAAWGTDPIDPFRVTTSKRAGYDWWSLQPVKRPALPSVKQKDWPRNPIDHFVLAKLEAEGLTPSPEADQGSLSRRLHFDLTGLPPTGKDPKELVNQLLASPQHGERWARHWLDVVRFGESNGFEHDELRKNAWPYRDWVIDAINTDMPFDEFTRWQIAGDVLKADDPGAVSATGFLVAGGYDSVGQGQPSVAMKMVVRQDELEDIVGTIGQTFLGLTVQCARCHDHKFDPVRIDEYYRLTAAVAGVRHGEREITASHLRLAFEKRQRELGTEIEALRTALTSLEKPIRAQILADRKDKGKTPKVIRPNAFARWDFTRVRKTRSPASR